MLPLVSGQAWLAKERNKEVSAMRGRTRLASGVLVLVLMLALAACGGGGGVAGPTGGSPGTGGERLTASLTDASGQPLAGMVVLLDGEDTGIVTDENGFFEIERNRLTQAQRIGVALRDESGSLIPLAEREISAGAGQGGQTGFSFGAGLPGDDPVPQPPVREVRGTVFALEEGDMVIPLAGAKVILVSGTGAVFLEITEEDGSYSFLNPPAGKALMIASKRGYRPALANVTVPEEGVLTKDFILRPVGSGGPPDIGTTIVGKVTDRATGEPVAGALVELFIFRKAPEPMAAANGQMTEDVAGAGEFERRPDDPRYGRPDARGKGAVSPEAPVRGYSGANDGEGSSLPSRPSHPRFYRITRTDAQGNYRFENVEGVAADLYVTKEGYRPARATIRLDRERVEQNFSLEPVDLGFVRGKVVRVNDGNGVARARVFFVLLTPRPGGPSGPSLPPESGSSPGGGGEGFPMGPSDEGGTAFPGGEDPWDEQGRPKPWADFIFETQSDENGNFHLRLPVGIYLAMAHKPGLIGVPELVKVEVGLNEVLLKMFEPQVGQVAGVVLARTPDSAEPQPLEGASVHLIPLGRDDMPVRRQVAQAAPPPGAGGSGGAGDSAPGIPGGPLPPDIPGLSTETGPDGHFLFPRVPAGRWALVVTHRGFRPHEETFLLEAGESKFFRVVLEPREVEPEPTVLKGQVRDSETGEPIAGAELWLTYPDDGLAHPAVVGGEAITDREGFYEMRVIHPGEWVLNAVHPRYQRFRHQLVIRGETQFDFEMEPRTIQPPEPLHLTGRVVDSTTGEPVSFARVRAVGSPNCLPDQPCPEIAALVRDITREDGTFDLKVFPGVWNLTVFHPNYQPYHQQVEVSEDTDLAVELEPRLENGPVFFAITGRVVVAGTDQPIAEANVWIGDPDPSVGGDFGGGGGGGSAGPGVPFFDDPLHVYRSLRDGRYVVYVTEGQWMLNGAKFGFVPFHEMVSVQGADLIKEIPLEPREGDMPM